jgi:aspartate dehydrogenase
MSGKLNIGLVGCGTIGTRMAQTIDQGEIIADLLAVNDLEIEKANDLIKGLKTQIPIILGLEEIFTKADLVVEAASSNVVPQILRLASRYKIDCMIMSVGGLLGEEDMIKEAKRAGIRIYCPSGAIAGLDAVAAASVGRVDSVRLTTRKPPQALKAAPYIMEKGIDLDAVKEERVIFEGTALEAVPAFPKNINVAAALSLAGVGPKRTIVRIIVDPKIKRNSHQIEVEGEFGKLITRTENLPAPFNPRTSYLAALSAIACLQKITNPLKLGG